MYKNNILVADLLKNERHITKLMRGGKCIYYPLQQKEDEKELGYFHFEALENGSTVKLPSMLQYSIDDGETWVQGNGGTLTINAGDKIYYKGDNTGVPTAFANQEGGLLNVKGNIMSLLYGDNYEGQTVIPENDAGAGLSGMNFAKLFEQCTNIADASNLLLPATSLKNGCYWAMFKDCHWLQVPPALPATDLSVPDYYVEINFGVYLEMFLDCNLLLQAPALPATVLSPFCYMSMFAGCYHLQTAPELPAITLTEGCYAGMFSRCGDYLTTAPELPATTLAEKCYVEMFQDCTNLNYIKMMATSSSGNEFENWVEGVAENGTFVKDADFEMEEGGSGIPVGWTVINE